MCHHCHCQTTKYQSSKNSNKVIQAYYKKTTHPQDVDNPPSSDDRQVDDNSKEHPVKDADENANKKLILHDPNVTKRLGRVTSGLSVGNALPANNSIISSINNHKSKGSTNISNNNVLDLTAVILDHYNDVVINL